MEPPTKRLCVEELCQQTISWYDLPFEMRILVIDEMDLDTMCRFSMCSKLCEDEVVTSKNYCNDLELKEESKCYGLYFSLRSHSEPLQCLIFESSKGSKDVTKIRCESGSKVQLWSKEENGNLIDVIIRYTNKYLQHFRNTLKRFSMDVTNASAKSKLIKGVRIRNMKSLECLNVCPSRKQICLLKHGFVDFEQIKSVTSFLAIPATKLSFDQLIQLQAKRIEIYLMDLTPKDLSKFVNYWSLGKLHPSFKQLNIKAEFNETLAKRRIMFEYGDLEYDELDVTWSRQTVYIMSEWDKTEDYEHFVECSIYDKGMLAEITVQ